MCSYNALWCIENTYFFCGSTERQANFTRPGVNFPLIGLYTHTILSAFVLNFKVIFFKYFAKISISFMQFRQKRFVLKRKIWCSTHTTFSYPALQQEKSGVHYYLNFVYYALLLNELSVFLYLLSIYFSPISLFRPSLVALIYFFFQ